MNTIEKNKLKIPSSLIVLDIKNIKGLLINSDLEFTNKFFCARCRHAFKGEEYRKEFCPQCSLSVCQKCKINYIGSKILPNKISNSLWLCTFCFKLK